MSEPVLKGQRRFLAERDARNLNRAKQNFRWMADWLGGVWTPDVPRFVFHYCRIRSLPSREWHGRTLYLVHCAACGKRRGVPEYVLWHLVDPTAPICEYCSRSNRVPAAPAANGGADAAV